MQNEMKNTSGGESQIRKIALTGGPGSGRREITMRMAAQFEEEVIIVQDTVRDAKEERGEEWQENLDEDYELEMMKRQLEYEMAARKDAEETEKPTIILCERGLPDLATQSKDKGESFYQKFGLKKEEALGLYDEVIHLETMAESKPELYNEKRKENRSMATPEKAKEIDQNLKNAWEGHENCTTIKATDSLDEKAAIAQSKIETCLSEINQEANRETTEGRTPRQY
ncbi:MAG: AAA family ATPase [Candidatus Berkelbacteria bacterium]|nr:AAA family ATPase [Candidatus Berkelbacteria bacterium]